MSIPVNMLTYRIYFLENGNYRIKIKLLSHLWKVFLNEKIK